VETLVRRTTLLAVSPETKERVRSLLLARKEEIGAHFGVELADCEEPQFLRYRTGDYFVAHQDGNTPMIRDDTRFRKVSAVLFLSTHSEEPAADAYGGGALVFHGPFTTTLRVPVTPPPGTLVAFRSETTHEVTPVTHGERYTIAAWFR
jgi:SM-20-related protein